MENITVLVTGAGAPGIIGTIYSLKNNYDSRKRKIVGVDIRNNVVGKHIIDSFYLVPIPEKEEDFVNRILEICELENVVIILPQVTRELSVFSRNRFRFAKNGIKVAVSAPESIEYANNKYKLTQIAEEIGCVPKFALVKNLDALENILFEFGYPDKPVVLKPPVSNGMRGLRIIDEKRNKYEAWKNEKPNGIYVTKDEFFSIFENIDIPEIMVVEYIPGPEYSVDCLAFDGTALVVVPRERVQIRSGITFHGLVQKNEKMIEYSKLLIEKLKLSYCFGFQFILDENNDPKIIECNPRIQGTMVASTFAGANLIYSSVKLLMNEKIPNFKIKWGTELLRYWGALGILNSNVVKI